MVGVNNLKEINARLRNKGCIWVNAEYWSEGELIKKELFLRLSGSRCSVGFDHYLDKYEDATSLYLAYVRRDFDQLSDAIEFCIVELSFKVQDFLAS